MIGMLAMFGSPFRVPASLRHAAVVLLSVAFTPSVQATEPAAQGSMVRTIGGELQIYWNRQLLSDIGLGVSSPTRAMAGARPGFEKFALVAASELRARRAGRGIQAITEGVLYVDGGYQLSLGSREIDLRNFLLRVRPMDSQVLDVTTAAGETLFYADHLMLESVAGGRGVAISTMDLRITSAVAVLLGKPEVADWQIATMRVESRGAAPNATAAASCAHSQRWPGLPVPGYEGAVYQADVFMQGFVVQVAGCKSCSGPSGDGLLKLAPTTVLRNNVNDGARSPTVDNDPLGTSPALFAADIPWSSKFEHACPPYNNDQHPILVWNLYKLDGDGRITQIGASGAKHAHTAGSAACTQNPQDNHILGPGCVDVYGLGDNDGPDLLGPRHEIEPKSVRWARCGSIYDPGCAGNDRSFKSYGDFDFRLVISERGLGTTATEGDKYLFEAWYLVRDDIDVYNTMAHAPLALAWSEPMKLWSIPTAQPASLGPAIDEWVDPRRPTNFQHSSEAITANGRMKLAVRVVPRSNGMFAYRYALMNVDYAYALLRGSEPNIRMEKSTGIKGLSLKASNVAANSIAASSLSTPGRRADWIVDVTDRSLAWRITGSSLEWGMVASFEFESPNPPRLAPAIARLGNDESISIDTLSPASSQTN